MVQSIGSLTEYKSLTNANQLVVVDFWAEWCGPCKAIAPAFEKISQSNPGVKFYKVDVDAQKEIASEMGIRAMPTFVFLKNGQKVDEVKGANASAIEAAIKKHGGASATSSSGGFSGAGRTLGGKIIEAPKEPSNLPDLKVIFAVLFVLGLWIYYGNDGNMGTPQEGAGMSPF